MATPHFHNGSDGLAKSGSTVLPINKWTLTVKGNNKDVSNARDGRSRIPGVTDAEGTLTMHWDSANQPTDTGGANFRVGAIVTLLLILDGATNGFQLSAIIDEINPSSEFEGTEDFDVKFSLAAGSSLVYPT